MQTQVTQKKVLKLKTTPGANADDGAPAAATQAPQVVVEAPESFTWAAILSILAVICFVALLIFQWVEFKDLSAAFPMKQAVSTAQ
jgi:hypothetical protein